MGCVLSCCYICLLGCAPKTMISLDISKHIACMLDEYINHMKDITFTIPPAWSPNLTHDKELIKYLTKQIVLALKSITYFKPYSFNGFTDEYITVNLSYYLVSCIGVWKSSQLYKGNKIYAFLAKLIVVLGISTTLLELKNILEIIY